MWMMRFIFLVMVLGESLYSYSMMSRLGLRLPQLPQRRLVTTPRSFIVPSSSVSSRICPSLSSYQQRGSDGSGNNRSQSRFSSSRFASGDASTIATSLQREGKKKSAWGWLLGLFGGATQLTEFEKKEKEREYKEIQEDITFLQNMLSRYLRFAHERVHEEQYMSDEDKALDEMAVLLTYIVLFSLKKDSMVTNEQLRAHVQRRGFDTAAEGFLQNRRELLDFRPGRKKELETIRSLRNNRDHIVDGDFLHFVLSLDTYLTKMDAKIESYVRYYHNHLGWGESSSLKVKSNNIKVVLTLPLFSQARTIKQERVKKQKEVEEQERVKQLEDNKLFAQSTLESKKRLWKPSVEPVKSEKTRESSNDYENFMKEIQLD